MKHTENLKQSTKTVLNRLTLKNILCSLNKIPKALRPSREDLNYTRWQELECRNHVPEDRFDQFYDRRFK